MRHFFSILVFLAPALAAVAATPAPVASPTPLPAPRKSVVYVAGGQEAMNGFAVNDAAVRAITDELVMAETGQGSVAGAWRSLVGPNDHIGIKISTAGGPAFSTHRAIVDAVVDGLRAAGVPMSQIVIWDRGNPAASGFRQTRGGPAVRFIAPIDGYDPKSVIDSPMVGRLIWGDLGFAPRGPDVLRPMHGPQLSLQSHWSKLVCGLTKIINLPVMAASENCALAGCLYNATIPNVDNWRRFVTDPAFGDPGLATLYADPHVGPKVVLNLMDGLVAQYGGGPDFEPNFAWAHATLYASRDPVAIDATAVRLLDQWRKDAKLPSVLDRAHYLDTAESMGLGRAGADEIELRPVGGKTAAAAVAASP